MCQAPEWAASGGVLAAECSCGQEGKTPSDSLQCPPERREHTPGRTFYWEGQVALVQGRHTHTHKHTNHTISCLFDTFSLDINDPINIFMCRLFQTIRPNPEPVFYPVVLSLSLCPMYVCVYQYFVCVMSVCVSCLRPVSVCVCVCRGMCTRPW